MFAILLPALLTSAAGLAECPGEGARYGDHKCNHDPTHRVCAQLLDKPGEGGQPLSWGRGNFWEITGQTAWQWDEEIRLNNGDSWCICMWATAELISAAGCENVHLHCDATDVDYVLGQYEDGGVDLAEAHQCISSKCGVPETSRLFAKFRMQKMSLLSAPASTAMVACGVMGALAFALLAARFRSMSSRSEAPSTDDESFSGVESGDE